MRRLRGGSVNQGQSNALNRPTPRTQPHSAEAILVATQLLVVFAVKTKASAAIEPGSAGVRDRAA